MACTAFSYNNSHNVAEEEAQAQQAPQGVGAHRRGRSRRGIPDAMVFRASSNPSSTHVFHTLLQVVDDFEQQMREAVNEEHEGKRRNETNWKIHRIHWEKNRFFYDLMYVRKVMSRELVRERGERLGRGVCVCWEGGVLALVPDRGLRWPRTLVHTLNCFLNAPRSMTGWCGKRWPTAR